MKPSRPSLVLFRALYDERLVVQPSSKSGPLLHYPLLDVPLMDELIVEIRGLAVVGLAVV